MPDIVAFGRKPDIFACGHCHRVDGSGGPENERLAGLPINYFLQQMEDFKNGARKSSVPQRMPTAMRVALSHAMTADEVIQAAEYFSALKPKRRVNVVEVDMVPRTYVEGAAYAISRNADPEPIGRRIIEVPAEPDLFAAYDNRAEFTAYVPGGQS
jgi:cytochrome c553